MVKKIVFILLYLFAILIFGEVFLRIYLRNKIIFDIEMTRYALTTKIDSKNLFIGHVHKPNVQVKLMGVMVETNSDGLRDKEYSIKRNKAYRIIFLGDSSTFGWGVEKESTFEYLIEEKLNLAHPAEIINFGIGNYNTEQEVNLFLEKGLKYQPDKVVVFYSINDAEKIPQKYKLWFFGYSRLFTFYWSKISILVSNIYGSASYKEYYSNLYHNGFSGWTRAEKAFLRLKNVCDNNGIKLQVVLLPETHDFVNYPFKNEHNFITAFLKSHAISVIDLAPFFESYTEPAKLLWVANDDAHLNANGHKLVAEYVFDFIANNEI